MGIGISVVVRGGVYPPGGGSFVNFGDYALYVGGGIIVYSIYLLTISFRTKE